MTRSCSGWEPQGQIAVLRALAGFGVYEKVWMSDSRAIRSLRIEYSIGSNCARNSFSGATEGRPTRAYIVSNGRESCERGGFMVSDRKCKPPFLARNSVAAL